MGVSIFGVETALRAMHWKATRDGVNIAIALDKCAHILLEKSRELVPVETGALRVSGRVVSSGAGFAARSYVSYDTPYAVYVHEDLTKYHEPPTQARFLADAVKKVRGAMTVCLARQIGAKTDAGVKL